MADLLERIAAAGPAFIWLDDTQYVAKLLGGGQIPWLDIAALIALRRKASALLRPSVTVLDVDAVMEACLAADGALRESIRAKKRAVVPLRVLLAAPNIRTQLVETARALSSTFAGAPLVLSMASPRKWVADAYQHAFGPAAHVDVAEEETDAASVYVAEFLRSFGDIKISGVLLQERSGAQPANDVEIGWYKPVINLCAHYRWDLGLQLPQDAVITGSLDAIAYAIAPHQVTGVVTGLMTPSNYWTGGALQPLASGEFRFAEIPPDSNPEVVLERLTLLRDG